jgi:hypothetical protein
MSQARKIDQPMTSKEIIYSLYQKAETANDVVNAIKKVEDQHSFDGYFRLGEFFKYGRHSCAERITVNVNAQKASEYFLQARKEYEKTTIAGQLQVKVYGEKTIPLPAHETITLTQINDLLKRATKGNPDSLYQLACFYQQELKSEMGKRKIHATTMQLQQWSKACLEASANLYHPHAAFMLLSEGLEKDPVKKLKLSVIAADPATAMHNALLKDQVQLRDESPLRDPIELASPANVTPEELFERQSISASSKITGLFASTGSTRGSCMLPVYHTAPALRQISSAPLLARTEEDVRAARLKRLGKSSSVTPSSKTTDVPVAQPTREIPAGRLAFVSRIELSIPHQRSGLMGFFDRMLYNPMTDSANMIEERKRFRRSFI